jgi:hypothetical protein
MDPVEQTRTALLDRFLQAQAVGVERSSGNGVVMILKVCVSNRVADAINPGPGGGGGPVAGPVPEQVLDNLADREPEAPVPGAPVAARLSRWGGGWGQIAGRRELP